MILSEDLMALVRHGKVTMCIAGGGNHQLGRHLRVEVEPYDARLPRYGTVRPIGDLEVRLANFPLEEANLALAIRSLAVPKEPPHGV